MSIVSSTKVIGPAQSAGRRYVTETHTDHLGAVHMASYWALAGYDTDARMTANAAYIADQLAEAEAAALAGDGA